MPAGIRLKGRLCVFGRLDPAEAMELTFLDLAALSRLLGDKKFFFGDKPSTLDCAVFGHLAQFLYIDINFPQESFNIQNKRDKIFFPTIQVHLFKA